MRFLILLLLISCAAPLTEEQEFQREYDENNRKVLYDMWKKACLDADGTVFGDRPARPCGNKRDCIPHKWDWDWNHDAERPKIGNSYQCATRQQIEELIRGIRL